MNKPVAIAASRSQTCTFSNGTIALDLSGCALTTRKGFSFMSGEECDLGQRKRIPI